MKVSLFLIVLSLFVIQFSTGEIMDMGVNGNANELNAARRLSILIVENTRVVRMVHERLLQKLGLLTTAVENGRQAVDLLRGGANFDLIVMDMDMPFMDGPQATKELREMGVSCMIIGVAAFGDEPQRTAFIEAGLNYFYVKPLTVGVVDTLRQELLGN